MYCDSVPKYFLTLSNVVHKSLAFGITPLGTIDLMFHGDYTILKYRYHKVR